MFSCPVIARQLFPFSSGNGNDAISLLVRRAVSCPSSRFPFRYPSRGVSFRSPFWLPSRHIVPLYSVVFFFPCPVMRSSLVSFFVLPFVPLCGCQFFEAGGGERGGESAIFGSSSYLHAFYISRFAFTNFIVSILFIFFIVFIFFIFCDILFSR